MVLWLSQKHAKLCEGLGLYPNDHYVYHKSHINKLMVIAVVGFAFVGSPENGGEGVKIAFTRAQCTKIAAKLQREATKNAETGAIEFKGRVIREKGTPYSVDCNVTGSNAGTSEAPKFDLKTFFAELVFDEVDKLVRSGGKFEGYKAEYQGDMAGPHEEDRFKKFEMNYCASKGWGWKPQAPQMPYMNVLDLGVFPSMGSGVHELTRNNSGSVANKEVVWRAAQQVWRERLPESKIARCFVLAWRLALVVIKNKGSNTFLRTKEMHQGVKQDFHDTLTGVVRKKK